MNKHIKSLILLATLPLSAQALELPGDELLGYFSATCNSQKEWTKAALSDTRALISVIDKIAGDPDCTSVAGALSSLNSLQMTITEIENRNSSSIEIEKLKAQEIELLKQLNNTTDPAVKYEIEAAIRSVQVQKATLLSEESAKQDLYGQDVKETYSKIVTSSDQIFNTLKNNQRCLDKNHSLLRTVTSLTSSLAASAYILNPAVAIGVSATTDFMGTAISSFRKGWFNRKVRKLSQNTLAMEGYTCALESLTNRWCDLRDAQNFIDFKAKLRMQTNRESGLKSVVRLNDRDIPVLLDWLNRVRAGVPASTVANGERQEKVFHREALVRSAEAVGNGQISESKPLYQAASNAKDKYNVLRTIITNLTGKECGSTFMRGGSDSSPLNDIYTTDYSPFYLLGLGTIPVNSSGFKVDFCKFDPFTEWPAGSYSPDLNLLEQRFRDWIEKARTRVNQELNLVLQPDALQVVTSAHERTGNKWKISTITAVKNIKNFLENYKPSQFADFNYEQIYTDTILDLKTILDIFQTNIMDVTMDPKEALKEIYTTMDLQYGTIVIQTRLEMAVRVSLDEYFKTLEGEEAQIASQLYAADSFLEVLQKISGTDNLGEIKNDVMRAQRVTLSNMEIFVKVFGKNLNQQLIKNKTKAASGDKLVANVYERNIAEVCLLLSSLQKWPESIDQSLCENVSIKPALPGGPSSVQVNSGYIQSSFSKRECGYRNYLRKTKIVSIQRNLLNVRPF